jgi:hypothetical protein
MLAHSHHLISNRIITEKAFPVNPSFHCI